MITVPNLLRVTEEAATLTAEVVLVPTRRIQRKTPLGFVFDLAPLPRGNSDLSET
ncbi:MAG: hypothetical protein N2111_13435 [Candidatus Sumerlaeaceae bacterium]|nr:hypothetical protein [Candidatus Sumerlaeaceae bacterium]